MAGAGVGVGGLLLSEPVKDRGTAGSPIMPVHALLIHSTILGVEF